MVHLWLIRGLAYTKGTKKRATRFGRMGKNAAITTSIGSG